MEQPQTRAPGRTQPPTPAAGGQTWRRLYFWAGLSSMLFVVLLVLVFVALFLALAPLDKSLALLATVIGALSWALILAVPVTSRGSLVLVYLSDRYAGEADDAARLRYSTAAEAIVAENNTPAVVGILSALGVLLISVVMLKGVLPRTLAWLGIATGGLGVVAEALRHAVPEFYWGYGVLLWVWCCL